MDNETFLHKELKRTMNPEAFEKLEKMAEEIKKELKNGDNSDLTAAMFKLGRPLNWDQIENDIDKATLSERDLILKRLDVAYRELRASFNIQRQLMDNLAKAAKDAERAMANLNMLLTEVEDLDKEKP